MTTLGLDRHVDAEKAPDRFRPRPRGVDEDRCRDVALRRADFGEAMAVQPRAGDFAVADDLHAERLRALRKSHRHAVRIGDAVGRAIGRALDAGEIEAGRQLARLVVRHPSHIDAVLLLQRDVLLERLDVRRFREQEQVAVLVKVDRRADDPFEVLHQGDRFDRQLDVRRVRELVAEAAGVLAGRSGAELRLALEKDDVGDAALGEVPGDAASHATTAGNDDIGRGLHSCDLIASQVGHNFAHQEAGRVGKRVEAGDRRAAGRRRDRALAQRRDHPGRW